MDVDPSPPPRAGSRGRAVAWHQWLVSGGPELARARLHGGAAARGGVTLPTRAPGTMTAASARWHGTWRRGGHHGPADVELTPLAPTTTLVELRLWPAEPHPRVPWLDRRRRDRVAATVAAALGTRASPRSRPPSAVLTPLLTPPGPGRHPVTVGILLVALLLAPTGWALLVDQGPTAVTEERALAEHRARVQQLTRATAPVPDDRVQESPHTGAPATPAATPTREAASGHDDEHHGEQTPPAPAAPAPSGDEATSPPTSTASDGNAADTGDDQPALSDEAPARAEPAPDVPDAGVYLYGTEGGDGVDVPGGSRTYPQRTSISVTHDGCGSVQRWAVLDERWDEREVCAGDGRVAAQTSFREFYGMARRHDLDCEEDRSTGLGDLEPGQAWGIVCEAEDTSMTGTIEVLGREDLEVRRTRVPTLHLRLSGQLTGGIEGEQHTERWLAPGLGGLVVRETSRTSATVASPVGRVDYREDYRLELLDVRPRQ